MTKPSQPCHSRAAHHPDKVKTALLGRLQRIEGQVRGIGRMVANDVYCDDILNQIAAVNAALGGVSRLLLKEHIGSCVSEQIKQGDPGVVEELVATIGKLLK